MNRENSFNNANMVRVVMRIAGIAALMFGILMAVFGSFWAPQTLQFSSENALGPVLEFFVPFLPIFLMLFGVYLLSPPNHREEQ